jgi:hypothetical protein
MVILHNVHQMTRVLKNLQNEGYTLNEQVLNGLAPYREGNILTGSANTRWIWRKR